MSNRADCDHIVDSEVCEETLEHAVRIEQLGWRRCPIGPQLAGMERVVRVGRPQEWWNGQLVEGCPYRGRADLTARLTRFARRKESSGGYEVACDGLQSTLPCGPNSIPQAANPRSSGVRREPGSTLGAASKA